MNNEAILAVIKASPGPIGKEQIREKLTADMTSDQVSKALYNLWKREKIVRLTDRNGVYVYRPMDAADDGAAEPLPDNATLLSITPTPTKLSQAKAQLVRALRMEMTATEPDQVLPSPDQALVREVQSTGFNASEPLMKAIQSCGGNLPEPTIELATEPVNQDTVQGPPSTVATDAVAAVALKRDPAMPAFGVLAELPVVTDLTPVAEPKPDSHLILPDDDTDLPFASNPQFDFDPVLLELARGIQSKSIRNATVHVRRLRALAIWHSIPQSVGQWLCDLATEIEQQAV